MTAPEVSRSEGIGGSELADVLNEDRGCARRLVYRKRGVPPDYPETNVLIFRRGHELEELAARRYAEETGHRVVRRSRVTHPDHPWAIASVDREVIGDPRGVGVLEVKTHGVHVFRKYKKEGLPAGHILQIAWYLHIRKREWGAFAILCPDTWEFERFDVARDDTLVEAILPRVERLWKMVEHGPLPEQLDPTDKRCRECRWRLTCFGMDISVPEGDREVELEADESLIGLLADLREQQARADEADGVVDLIKDELRRRLGEREAVQAGAYRVYYRNIVSKRVDTKLLRARHPEIAKSVEVPSASRSLRVYGGGANQEES